MAAATRGGTHVSPHVSPHVSTVLVSHDGARWQPQVLDALAAQTRLPDALVAVDTASTDDSVRLLTDALGADAVLSAPRDTGFGAAVARGIDALDAAASADSLAPESAWVWLLHDDCAPAPDALETLLRAVEDRPDIGVVGPKVREWPSLRRLLEVGVTITGTGRRETGLEPGEPDQGQHDSTSDVLAVGTAGLLVRRSAWDAVGGFDPRLPLYGDDLDLGWRVNRAGMRVRVVPDALVFHAEAAARRLRTPGAVSHSPRRERRRAALFVLLANCRGLALPWQYVRLLVGSVLRALGLLLLKAPVDAWDELAAAASTLGRPWRLVAARYRRRRTARVGPGAVRPLLPSALKPYRDGVAAVLDVTGGLGASGRTAIPRAVAEPGPVADEAEELPPEPTPLARVAARPWASTVLVLALLVLVAVRGLFTGGALQGGALLPAPDGICDWWAAYTAGWHPVGAGSTAPAPPYVLVLGVAGVLTLGDADLLVSLLLLGAPVLAALGAHRLLRRAGAGPAGAVWAAVAYGSLPLVTGAMAQGRLGTVLGTAVLPLVAVAALSLTDEVPPLQRWVRRFRAGLAAAVLAALVPVAWPMLAVVAVGFALASVRSRHSTLGAAASLVVVLAVPWLLAPWWLLRRVTDPTLWWWEAGLPDAGVGPLDPDVLEVALGLPGGPGAAPVWLGGGVVLAGLLALLRVDRRSAVVGCWAVGVLGLLVAAAGLAVDPVALDAVAPTVWVGFPLVVWWGGLLTAAAVAACDLRGALAGRSFGWLQPTVVVVAAAAVLGPLAALGWQVAQGVGDPLRRADPVALPAYMAEDARTDARPAAMVLVAEGEQVAATLVREDGWRLGEEPMRAAVAPVELTAALSGLLTTPTGTDIGTIAGLGVGYLLLPDPVDPDLAGALDSAPGIIRAGAPAGDRAWRLVPPGGTLRAGEEALPLSSARADGGPRWEASAPGGPGASASAQGRRLTIAARPDPAWRATLDGAPLVTARAAGGGTVQAFALPVSGGDVEVAYESRRGWWVIGQLVALGLVLVLAAPTRRRRS